MKVTLKLIIALENRINMKDTKNPQDNEQFVKKVPSYEQ